MRQTLSRRYVGIGALLFKREAGSASGKQKLRSGDRSPVRFRKAYRVSSAASRFLYTALSSAVKTVQFGFVFP